MPSPEVLAARPSKRDDACRRPGNEIEETRMLKKDIRLSI